MRQFALPVAFLAVASAVIVAFYACQAKPPAAADPPSRLERIKAAKMPKIETPIQFDTKEADDILAALEVFPSDNPWNAEIEAWPLHPKSKEMIETVGREQTDALQPGHGIRSRSARSEEGRRQAREVSG